MTLQQDVQSWTIRDLMKFSINYLQRHGFDEARLTVELLLSHALECQRIELYTHFEKPLSKEELKRFRACFERRLAHEPVQYIVGATSFMGLHFVLDRRVFIPRPETETLVEQVMMTCNQRKPNESTSILEVGTGSGNIAVALVKLLRGVHVTTIDRSSEALDVARANAAAHGVAEKITFVEGDVFGAIETAFSSPFDVVASNPPYVSALEWNELDPEVRQFEPQTAVSDMEDGYKFYRRLADLAAVLLRREGSMVVEVGAGQAESVTRILAEVGFGNLQVARDLQDIPRIVFGVWRGV
jgi:release factor glutamine methyltransferase